MKEKIYKYCIYSFVLINFWTLYGFFDYYLDMQEPSWFHGLGLGIFYFNSLFLALGFGGILLLIRLIFHFIKKRNILKSNFLYIFSGMFSLNLLMISFISIALKMLGLDRDFIPYLLGLILISSITIWDIYKSNFKISK